MSRSLDDILRRVVAKGFPELKRLRIAIEFGELDPDTCFFYDQEAGRYRITVNDILRGAPTRALEGGIAHELAHIVHDSRLGRRQRELALARYARSAAYRMRDERSTDMRQIERGYGPELLAFLSFARTLRIRFTRAHGLVLSEISARLRLRPVTASESAGGRQQ